MAILGRVNSNREAVIVIRVGAPDSDMTEILSIVDTGFTDYLTLPAAAIAQLGLQFREIVQAQLADGSIADIPTYAAVAEWHGETRRIVVCQAEGGPLLGMAMLEGSRLTLDAIPGGGVLIEIL